MMDGLKPYPAYKDFGVPWLGEVPEHWGVCRLKYILRERDARSETGNEQLLSVSQYLGVTERKLSDSPEGPATRAESLIGYKRVDPGDLVVNIMLAWNGSMGVSRYGGIVVLLIACIALKRCRSPGIFIIFFGHPSTRRGSRRSLRASLKAAYGCIRMIFIGFMALLPPLPEQTAIVRFLDWAERRIRRVIRARRRRIKLLEEYKQALIHQAVTGRIDVRTGKP
jgi:type I restriction enzyme S subunit